MSLKRRRLLTPDISRSANRYVMSSEAQLDGSGDTCSSRSSVDKSQPPSPAVAAIVDEAGEDDSNHSPRTMTAKRAFPPPSAAAAARRTIMASVGGMNIIQQRMKQTQQSPPTTPNSPAGGGGNMRPKSKLSLIRHVFKTYTKGRRVVDVKVRWAEGKIRDLDDYLRWRKEGEEDEVYDEERDRDGTIAQPSPPTPLKRPLSSEDAARSASSSPNPKRPRSLGGADAVDAVNEEDADIGEEWFASMFDFESLQCKPCSKTFPNAARLSAHKQMHLDEMRKKRKRCKVATGQKTKALPQLDGAFDVDFDSEDEEEAWADNERGAGLPQLDGENDVMMPIAPASAHVPGPPTTSAAAGQQQRQNGGGQSVILTTSAPPSSAAASNEAGAATFASSAQSNPTHVFIVRTPQQQSAGAQLPASQVLVKQESFQPQSSKSSPTAQSSTASTSRSSSSPVSANALPAYAKELLVLEHSHPMLIKQDPVMVPLSSVLPSKSGGSGGDAGGGSGIIAASATDAAIVDQDLILPDALHLFEGTPALDSSDSAIQISLDDIANFAQPINTSGGGVGSGSVGIGGAESHASFDTSIETSSFLSGADALDIVSETTNGTNTSGIRFVRITNHRFQT